MSELKGGYSTALNFIMRRELFGIKLGLENITKFLNRIGNPQNNFRAVHIAGTNGKGSTAAFIESILREAGYKTGIFTSPHLVDYRERIRVDGRQIEKKYIVDFVKKYRHLISRNKITFFETCTALAFSYFADKKVDIAIVEVGLGGRLDATSTLTPIVSVITDISYDHINILGDTLKKIAYEKAGIVKKNVPTILGLMKPEPRTEIARVCRDRKSALDYLRPSHLGRNGRPFKFDYNNGGLSLNNLDSSLPGEHQVKNAALALRVVEALKPYGYQVGKRQYRRGLKKTEWPGRFQLIDTPGRPKIILDVGHNPAGIRALVDTFSKMYPGRKADIVIGFVRNKNLEKSIGYIQPITARAEVVRLNTHRTADPDEVASYFNRSKKVTISESVVDSTKKLVESARPDDIIIVCGSHYAVGDFVANKSKIL